MFEGISYNLLLERMLERVPDSFDKREGSVIYDALSPAAMELMKLYIELERVLNESFADTASREFLIRRCKERGIYPKAATNAVLRGLFVPESVNVEGTRFNIGEINYTVGEKISDGVYRVICESIGAVGNRYLGDMLPIDYVDGLNSARLIEVLIPGEDEESTEALRARYLDSFEKKAFGGNVQDYTEKTLAIAGVGAVKVTPVWDGGGTVLLTILDSELNAPSSELVSAVKNAADPEGNSGSGYGFAPIGHTVTVRGANEVSINIAAAVEYDSGFSFASLEDKIKKQLSDYLFELRGEWSGSSGLIVRLSRIETRLLSIKGIADIARTAINGAEENLRLAPNDIPVLGGVDM